MKNFPKDREEPIHEVVAKLEGWIPFDHQLVEIGSSLVGG